MRAPERTYNGGCGCSPINNVGKEEHPMSVELIGTSTKFRHVLEAIALVGRVDSTVLILGETGTGKELVAHAIHAAGARSKQRFVAVNCAAIPAPLMESELFG